MINYDFNPSEEIARWAAEVYIKNNQKLGWWIAFTNPTAGPWKKIVIPTKSGTTEEIYRFAQEEERPDLILVNDGLKTILIIEAKDRVVKLTTKEQMSKSIRVIKDMISVLRKIKNSKWQKRKNYKIIPGFLWMCEEYKNILAEDLSVRKSFKNLSGSAKRPVDIIISKDIDGSLISFFVYQKNTNRDLNSVFS